MYLEGSNLNRTQLENAFLKAKWVKDSSYENPNCFVYTDKDSGNEMMVSIVCDKKHRERLLYLDFYEFNNGGTAYSPTFEKSFENIQDDLVRGFSSEYIKGISIDAGFLGISCYGGRYFSYDMFPIEL